MVKEDKDLIRRKKKLLQAEEKFEKRKQKFENLYSEKDSTPRLLWRFFYNNLYWMFLVLSLILLVANKTYWTNSEYHSLIEKIGMTILTSGVFATLLKSFQFTGLFQQEIRKVMLGTEFIDNRKDIIPLWKKVSKGLNINRFLDIVDKLEIYILKTYFLMNFTMIMFFIISILNH